MADNFGSILQANQKENIDLFLILRELTHG